MSDLREIAVSDEVPVDEIERALSLAVLATEALHGTSALQVASPPELDTAMRTLEVDCASPVGRSIALILVGLLSQAHGPDAVETIPLDRRRA